jgi:hypothetical protein
LVISKNDDGLFRRGPQFDQTNLWADRTMGDHVVDSLLAA